MPNPVGLRGYNSQSGAQGLLLAIHKGPCGIDFLHANQIKYLFELFLQSMQHFSGGALFPFPLKGNQNYPNLINSTNSQGPSIINRILKEGVTPKQRYLLARCQEDFSTRKENSMSNW